MKAVEPLLRGFSSCPSLSCSRIPHLAVQIRQKHALSQKQKVSSPSFDSRISGIRSTPSASHKVLDQNLTPRHITLRYRHVIQSRSSSILTYNHEYSDQDVETRHTVAKTSSAQEGTYPAGKFLDSDELVNVYDILHEGNPERVLFALADKSIGSSFIKGADDESFAEAFCTLDPAYFIEAYKPLYKHMKQSLQETPKFRRVRSFEDRFESFAELLDDIIGQRRNAQGYLTLDVYRHLLKWADNLGDGQMARHALNYMMPEDHVKPDLAAYNNFLGAINWSHAFSTQERFHMRVTPRNLQIRGSKRPPGNLSGHRIGAGGVRSEALEIFKKLVTEGFRGDEVTFTNIMIALGRDGDLSGVKSILKSVWNIDVELLDVYDEEEIESPTFYETDSPLRPTWRLLAAIVHVFGSNNEVGLASSLLDYVSRNCNIEVPERVLSDLYEWAFVLSLHRSAHQRQQHQNVGKIDHAVLNQFFSLITDEPYQMQPSFDILHLRARSQLDKGLLTEALSSVRTAKLLLDEHRTELSICYDEILASLNNPMRDGFLSASFLEIRQKFILASLKVDYELQLLIILMRKVLQQSEWAGAGKQSEWSHRLLPSLIEEFAEFLPNHIRYQTPTGFVEIHAKNHRTKAVQQANDTQTRKTGIMRTALDTEDHERLVNNITILPELLQPKPNYCPSCATTEHSKVDCPWDQTMWLVQKGEKLPGPIPLRPAKESRPSRFNKRVESINRD